MMRGGRVGSELYGKVAVHWRMAVICMECGSDVCGRVGASTHYAPLLFLGIFEALPDSE